MDTSNKAKYILLAVNALMLLAGAFLTFQYSYYQLLRVVTTGVSAYSAFNTRIIGQRWVLIAIAAIYNPFFPIKGLSKDMWCVINVATVVAYALVVYHDYKAIESAKKQEEQDDTD